MIPAVLAALAWAPALVGLGAIVRLPGDPDVRPGVAGLVGLVTAGAAGAVVNLVAPLGSGVSVTLWGLGAVVLAVRRRWLLEGLRAWDVAALVALVAALSWLMRNPNFQYDSNYYHEQAVAWTRRGAIVPGIANIHFRLGFNSIWTTTAAVVDLPFALGKSWFFLNQLPILFAGQLALVGLRSVGRGSRAFSDLMLAGTVLPVASATFGIGGLYVDYTAALYVYVALALWARALDTADGFSARAAAPAMLSVITPSLKLSVAPLAAAAAVALVLRGSKLDRPWWIRFAPHAAALTLPTLVRGFLTSGCVAFPASLTCWTSGPWTVPQAKTRAVAAAIQAWARTPGSLDSTGWRWVVPWWYRIAEDYPEWNIAVALAVAGTLAWVLSRKPGSGGAWMAIGTSAVGIAYWFLTMPDPRFALGFLYAFALTPPFAALAVTATRPLARWPGVGTSSILGFSAAALAIVLDGHPRTGTTYGLPPWRPPLFEWPELFVFNVEPALTRSGLTVLVATNPELCGAAPVPCAPASEFDPALRFNGYFYIDRPR
jgi:hypothetical protein